MRWAWPDSKARELDGSAEGGSDHERREWLAAFWGELARYLAKWQDIKMRRGSTFCQNIWSY